VNPECKLGANRVHIVPPIAICPTVLDRQRSLSKEKQSNKSAPSTSGGSASLPSNASSSRLTRSESNAEAIPVSRVIARTCA
jgi:hypothetical protein